MVQLQQPCQRHVGVVGRMPWGSLAAPGGIGDESRNSRMRKTTGVGSVWEACSLAAWVGRHLVQIWGAFRQSLVVARCVVLSHAVHPTIVHAALRFPANCVCVCVVECLYSATHMLLLLLLQVCPHTGERGVDAERRGSRAGRGELHSPLPDGLPPTRLWGVGVHMPWLGVKGTVHGCGRVIT